ncbi:MAG: aldo/keto reductase [Myxococcota bacterium]
MQYVDTHGAKVPALGLGTWQMQGRTCRDAVEKAIELGYRHFDTAQMYGNEADVGAGLEAAIRTGGLDRDDFWITTKLDLGNLARDDVRKSTLEGLKRLSTRRIDLLLIHWPSPEVPLRETLDAMRELVEEGWVGHLGVSNFPPALLKEALGLAPLSCIQVEYHPFLSQHALLELAREHGLMFTAYSPLARGRVNDEPVLQTIGERHGKSPAQVTLRWLMQQDRVAAVPKASSEAHLRENLDVFDFELTPDEMRQVFELERGERIIDPDFAPDW